MPSKVQIFDSPGYKRALTWLNAVNDEAFVATLGAHVDAAAFAASKQLEVIRASDLYLRSGGARRDRRPRLDCADDPSSAGLDRLRVGLTTVLGRSSQYPQQPLPAPD